MKTLSSSQLRGGGIVQSLNEKMRERVYAVLPTPKARVLYVQIFLTIMMVSFLGDVLVYFHLWDTVSLVLSIIVFSGFISIAVFVIVRLYQVKRHMK